MSVVDAETRSKRRDYVKEESIRAMDRALTNADKSGFLIAMAINNLADTIDAYLAEGQHHAGK